MSQEEYDKSEKLDIILPNTPNISQGEEKG